MARATTTTVRAILDTSLTDAQILEYIDIANRLVTRLLGSSDLTAADLLDIETWMTAHLIASTKERQVANEKVGDMWVTYQGKYGMSLESTTYGQTALMLDTTGSLQRATKKKIRIRAIQQDSDRSSTLETDEW